MKVRRAPSPLRVTSGAGFEFEDRISAWLMMKMLTGEQAPAIGGTGTQIQAQVSTLGWRIDDLLLTIHDNADSPRRLAISVKGNLQVSASGLPADFVKRAWEQWLDPQSLMSRSGDGLALVTLGTHPAFDPTWREVKYACSGSDAALAMSRIRSNPKQSTVFDSVRQPDEAKPAASDEETIELIRRLHVLPVDFQLPYSEKESEAKARCRQILASGDATEAEKLWKRLINVANEVRLSLGTITLPDLWSLLRKEFDLVGHPDFGRDWLTLSRITSDCKARVATSLPSGYAVPRPDEELALGTKISANAVTVVFGDSGSGKSALAKNVLNAQFGAWTQVWFAPDDLKTALSASRRGTLPLVHPLNEILIATANAKNVLVFDSAERIESIEFGVIRQLVEAILSPTDQTGDGAWHVVVITQTQSWIEGQEAMLGDHRVAPFELGPLNTLDVMKALWASPSLGWLTGHQETIAALTNLKTLGWVVQAGAALGSNPSGLASHTAIADSLWKYWTGGRADAQALTMRLASREASFERSFALTDLNPADVATFTQRPAELPLYLNQRTNHIEFEHDLAADWARFQFLKQFSTDTARWAPLAENPLWANALRMLGQFLLRQPSENGTAWDTAFEAAEAAELRLAGDILLDALCLDPEAERFLTERVELLLADRATHLSRLLVRFHHTGTVPADGMLGISSSIGLYIETRFRSVIIGRWPPVLRFLIAQRERLGALASPAVAKIIQTWLTGTPSELDNGMQAPFRRELTDLVLAMARTVQVEKGHGVMYLTHEPLLYTAPLAGAADLPDEVGAWALELAGRRKITDEVTARIAKVRRQQAEQHAKRLRTDREYREQHEARRRIPPSIGPIRDRLPPWPLGATRRVDMDFHTACLNENGIVPLMRALPDVAAEVLLALVIEDQPEREYGSSRLEVELGLDYARDGYPTVFWKSPFFPFLQIAPDVALKALIALVNFCTARWAAEVMKGQDGPAPHIILQLTEGEAKAFTGWWQVFDWTQSNSNGNGNMFCALDALERWLTLQIDAGIDITPRLSHILHETDSVALIGLLVNVGKYRPSLLSGALAPLLSDPHVFIWDQERVKNINYNFDSLTWSRAGQTVFDLARDWTLAPHRQKQLLDVAIDLLKTDSGVAARLQALIPTWSIPKDPKEAIEFKLVAAMLNRVNYRAANDLKTGTEVLVFACPTDISLEVQSWQDKHAKPLQYLLLPGQCEKILQVHQALDDNQATYLYKLLRDCETDAASDEGTRTVCCIALAATLIVLGGNGLATMPDAREHILSIIRTAVGKIASAGQEIRNNRIGPLRDELKFAAHAAMHLWMQDDDRAIEWERSVICLLTSGDAGAAGVVVGNAYARRQQLGSAWWRILQVGVLWSGLVLLSPRPGGDESVEQTWGRWLARLRRLPLRGKNATVDDLRLGRVATGCERLDFDRRMRKFTSGDTMWLGKPEHRSGIGLDSQYLEVLFHWLINGTGPGDWAEDVRLVNHLWAYEIEHAKARAKDRTGEYDLPSQHFGYDLLRKLSELSLAAPETEATAIWESVLTHGPEAHYAVQHFISGLFLRLSKGEDPAAFERVWRAATEYGLAASWEKNHLWFYGERLLCDLLGFGNEDALRALQAGAALRMHDIYERWADAHLGRDEECVARFCYFLTTEFGAPLRLEGLRWIAAMLKTKSPSGYWYRDGTGGALVELLNTSLNQSGHALVNDGHARQALLEIAAVLASKNIPAALGLQERIRVLR